jgi:uncharacterized protein (DUF58 family)
LPGPISSADAPLRNSAAVPAGDVKARIRSRIPLTLRGCVFSTLAAVLSLAGSLRAELGALFCGAGLAAAILLSLVGALVEGRRFRRATAIDAETLELGLEAPHRGADGSQRGTVSVLNRELPPPRAPGIVVVLVVELSARNGRSAKAVVPLPAKGQRETGALPAKGALLRGVYRGGAALEVRDAFGFCSVRAKSVRDLEIAALPEPKEPSSLAIRGNGGEQPLPSLRLVRGEDSFDARPYVPGDDPRRVHWKLYARFGDLFIRPGDLAPPPRQAVRILVDTLRPAYMAGNAGQAYLDDLVAWALGCARILRARGFRVICSAPGMPEAPESDAGMELWFADLAWSEERSEAEEPGQEELVVFGAPGSAGCRAFLAVRGAQGSECVLAIPGLPEHASSSWTERLFLAPSFGEKQEPDSVFRTAFSEALAKDIRELGGTGGVDVRIL